jgi:hypothetical protein
LARKKRGLPKKRRRQPYEVVPLQPLPLDDEAAKTMNTAMRQLVPIKERAAHAWDRRSPLIDVMPLRALKRLNAKPVCSKKAGCPTGQSPSGNHLAATLSQLFYNHSSRIQKTTAGALVIAGIGQWIGTQWASLSTAI